MSKKREIIHGSVNQYLYDYAFNIVNQMTDEERRVVIDYCKKCIENRENIDNANAFLMAIIMLEKERSTIH